jgi:hypothetical protein
MMLRGLIGNRACRFFCQVVATVFTSLILAGPAVAATFHVDDSASLPNETTTAMRWKSLSPSRTADNVVEGTTLVTVRLNVAPWLNRTGKIYMVLPVQPVGQVKAEWATQGRLLPGQLISGNRTLVYTGPIRSNMIEDTLALKLQADGRRLAALQRLQFHFEIDVD